MMEVIKSETQMNSTLNNTKLSSTPVFEATQFMKNFIEALQNGNSEEIASYYADEADYIALAPPANVEWTDESLFVEDHIATFKCCLRAGAEGEQSFTCVLDKSEGYWQIIHCEIKDTVSYH